ncbi:flavoprotein [Robertmurraya kyonggiensis]|uniref:Flavoprotein n=1 Tax=Robertmurraya kyonggiensis TaxID=1037680 RepID=A0A4U1D8Y7_9BACI|nr:flavoprotein [Robertmurraya kyonggiensis]TKC18941.1 flavoprotein [Robertmurraya kyonggiensis]
MDHTFRHFLDRFLEVWSLSVLEELKNMISEDYHGREISNSEIIDFGYVESLDGWEQGFKFVNEHNAKWILKEMDIIPLRENENLVIISATMEIYGKRLKTGNLFFDTFRKNDLNEWKLVRSYIEAGNFSRAYFEKIEFDKDR